MTPWLAEELMVAIVPSEGNIWGSGSVPLGWLSPVMVIKLAVASCPISFWLFSSVTGPV